MIDAFWYPKIRPEWLISDIAIMLCRWNNGSSILHTYTEDDYEYLIEDCEPSLVIVSNHGMLKKLNNTINEKKIY